MKKHFNRSVFSFIFSKIIKKTCYICRIHDHGNNTSFEYFSPLHSIVYKVLSMSNMKNDLKRKLCG